VEVCVLEQGGLEPSEETGAEPAIENEGPRTARFRPQKIVASAARRTGGAASASPWTQLIISEQGPSPDSGVTLSRERNAFGRGHLRLADWLDEADEWRPGRPPGPSRYNTAREPFRF
jgi:hypothetical protein